MVFKTPLITIYHEALGAAYLGGFLCYASNGTAVLARLGTFVLFRIYSPALLTDFLIFCNLQFFCDIINLLVIANQGDIFAIVLNKS